MVAPQQMIIFNSIKTKKAHLHEPFCISMTLYVKQCITRCSTYQTQQGELWCLSDELLPF